MATCTLRRGFLFPSPDSEANSSWPRGKPGCLTPEPDFDLDHEALSLRNHCDGVEGWIDSAMWGDPVGPTKAGEGWKAKGTPPPPASVRIAVLLVLIFKSAHRCPRIKLSEMAAQSGVDASDWRSLLNSTSDLVTQDHHNFPRVDRSIQQLQQYAETLRSRTSKFRTTDNQISASRLLAQQGFDASRLTQDVVTLEITPTIEDVFHADTRSVEDYLKQVEESTILSAIQESQNDTVTSFESYMEDCMTRDWASNKQQLFGLIAPHSGSLQSANYGAGAFAQPGASLQSANYGAGAFAQPGGGGAVASAASGPLRLAAKEQAYVDVIRRANQAAANGDLSFNLVSDFTSACKSNDDKTHETSMGACWALLGDMLGEAHSRGVPPAPAAPFAQSMLQGAKKHLERGHAQHMRNTLLRHKLQAERGADPELLREAQSYIQVKFGSKGLLDFQQPGGHDTSWIQVYFCLRNGWLDAARKAAERAHDVSLSRLGGHGFKGMLDEWLNNNGKLSDRLSWHGFKYMQDEWLKNNGKLPDWLGGHGFKTMLDEWLKNKGKLPDWLSGHGFKHMLGEWLQSSKKLLDRSASTLAHECERLMRDKAALRGTLKYPYMILLCVLLSGDNRALDALSATLAAQQLPPVLSTIEDYMWCKLAMVSVTGAGSVGDYMWCKLAMVSVTGAGSVGDYMWCKLAMVSVTGAGSVGVSGGVASVVGVGVEGVEWILLGGLIYLPSSFPLLSTIEDYMWCKLAMVSVTGAGSVGLPPVLSTIEDYMWCKLAMVSVTGAGSVGDYMWCKLAMVSVTGAGSVGLPPVLSTIEDYMWCKLAMVSVTGAGSVGDYMWCKLAMVSVTGAGSVGVSGGVASVVGVGVEGVEWILLGGLIYLPSSFPLLSTIEDYMWCKLAMVSVTGAGSVGQLPPVLSTIEDYMWCKLAMVSVTGAGSVGDYMWCKLAMVSVTGAGSVGLPPVLSTIEDYMWCKLAMVSVTGAGSVGGDFPLLSTIEDYMWCKLAWGVSPMGGYSGGVSPMGGYSGGVSPMAGYSGGGSPMGGYSGGGSPMGGYSGVGVVAPYTLQNMHADLSRWPASYYSKQGKEPLLYITVLLLSLQFQSALRFLWKDETTRQYRVDAVHLAIALHQEQALGVDGSGSGVATDPLPDSASMVHSYGRKFVPHDSSVALQYYMLAAVMKGNSIAVKNPYQQRQREQKKSKSSNKRTNNSNNNNSIAVK
eukprot:gene20446-27235_t